MQNKDFNQEIDLLDDGEVVAIYSEEEAKKLGIIDFLESAGDTNE